MKKPLVAEFFAEKVESEVVRLLNNTSWFNQLVDVKLKRERCKNGFVW